MTMEDMLGKVADGWTVKARFKTRAGHATIEGVVQADEKSRWWCISVPAWNGNEHLLPLCQIAGVANGDLVEVLSVTPPPVYTNNTDVHPQPGDVVTDASGASKKWVFLPSSGADGDKRWGLWEGAHEGSGRQVWGRDDLPEKLRLVGRVQPWPVKDADAEEVFATAQRMIAKQIRALQSRGAGIGQEYNEALDEAARVVEHFDFGDPYEAKTGYSDTWQ